jgi:putative transposase
VTQYQKYGLAGLSPKDYVGEGRRGISAKLRDVIEGLALQKPRISVAAIHRKLVAYAAQIGESAPSYKSVYLLVQRIDPALMTLAHEGTKVYSDTFDLLHRMEAPAPNAVWQADHTQMDLWVLDEKHCPRKPWLTVILDDYSRAVAGYFLSFAAPSALQTALALRQAIWRKAQPGWEVCGIPEVLYTDHGSDFTSRHIEQVVADLKIRLVFSTIGKPRGRGKVERFFATINQVFLSGLPGYAPSGAEARPSLTLPQLAAALETYLIHEYHVTPHTSTGVPPQARWSAGGFLPQMPVSMEQLDLLLLTVARTRLVRQDGIRFMGFRYISPVLAAYVGEEVTLRYDPRDVAEVRLFHRDKFLCRAICQELAGGTITLREIVRARDERRGRLRQTLKERQQTVDSLLDARRWTAPTTDEQSHPATKASSQTPKLKRYRNE